MTQSDYIIQNQAMPSARQDINTCLDAILTNNSGATEPATKKAGQYWFDTTTNLLKVRDSSNTSWNIIGSINYGGLRRVNTGNPNGVLTGLYTNELIHDSTGNMVWVNTSGTAWVNTFGTSSNTYRELGTLFHSAKFQYVDTNSVKILAGAKVRSSDDTTDILLNSDLTLSLTTDLDTGTEAINTWYYIYLMYNPSTQAVIGKYSLVNSGTPTLPSGYTKFRQLRIAVRNDASSNILPFTHIDNRFYYWSDYLILNAGTASTFTAVSFSSVIPPISRLGIFNFQLNSANGQLHIRETGTTGSGFRFVVTSNTSHLHGGLHYMPTNSSQQLDYYRQTGGDVYLYGQGFVVTEI